MFLNIKTLLTMVLVSLSVSAQAANLERLETGRYELTSGEKNLCSNFTVTEATRQSKKVTFGGFYGFEVRNSDHNVESDLDASCEFREQNRLSEEDNSTVLVRINEEICKGKLRSRTVSEAKIREGEIEIHHQVGGAELNCIWIKK